MIKVNNRLVANKHSIARSAVQKFLGLMFQMKVKHPSVFFFDKEQKVSIHMLFVFMSIDILFINEEWQIVEIKKSLQPFTFYLPKKKAQYVIELPAGSVEAFKLHIGQKVMVSNG